MQRNKILCGTRSCYVAQANFKIPCSGDPSDPVPSASALWQLVEKIFKSTLQEMTVAYQSRQLWWHKFLCEYKVALKKSNPALVDENWPSGRECS